MFSSTVASVGFTGTMYTIDEDQAVTFCVEVEGASQNNCLTDFPFNITLVTVDSSAGNDLHTQWFCNTLITMLWS